MSDDRLYLIHILESTERIEDYTREAVGVRELPALPHTSPQVEDGQNNPFRLSGR